VYLTITLFNRLVEAEKLYDNLRISKQLVNLHGVGDYSHDKDNRADGANRSGVGKRLLSLPHFS